MITDGRTRPVQDASTPAGFISTEGISIMGLVLSRKIGERIWIGSDISIMPVRISETQVRFQIDAPKELSIVREELRGRPIQVGENDIAELGRK